MGWSCSHLHVNQKVLRRDVDIALWDGSCQTTEHRIWQGKRSGKLRSVQDVLNLRVRLKGQSLQGWGAAWLANLSKSPTKGRLPVFGCLDTLGLFDLVSQLFISPGCETLISHGLLHWHPLLWSPRSDSIGCYERIPSMDLCFKKTRSHNSWFFNDERRWC